MMVENVKPLSHWASRSDGPHNLGVGRDGRRPAAVPTSRADVGPPLGPRRGMGSAADTYRS